MSTQSARATNDSNQPPGNPARVVARLQQLTQVLQPFAQFERFPVEVKKPITPSVEVIFARAEVDDGKMLLAEIHARFEARVKDPDVSKVDLLRAALVETRFVLVYELSPGEDLSTDDLQAFAQTNAVFNATPFWREFLNSCLVRMGMPPFMVPIMRLGSSLPKQQPARRARPN